MKISPSVETAPDGTLRVSSAFNGNLLDFATEHLKASGTVDPENIVEDVAIFSGKTLEQIREMLVGERGFTEYKGQRPTFFLSDHPRAFVHYL